jgi:hypothetical protein
MPQLRAVFAEAGEAPGELADRRMARIGADGRAFERAILGEAADDLLDIAGIV